MAKGQLKTIRARVEFERPEERAANYRLLDYQLRKIFDMLIAQNLDLLKLEVEPDKGDGPLHLNAYIIRVYGTEGNGSEGC